MNEQRNLILAVVLSFAVLFGFNYFVENVKQEKMPHESSQIAQKTGQSSQEKAVELPTQVETPEVKAPVLKHQEALAENPRIKIETPKLRGSINLLGARIDDLSLEDYRETTDANSPKIILLSPSKTLNPYYADFGWVPSSKTSVAVPGNQTLWKADHERLAPGKPVTLSWDNGQGCLFERVIAVDDLYVFTVTDRIINKTSQALKINSYGKISRIGTPVTGGFYILHEGPIGVVNNKLQELDYKKLLSNPQEQYTTGGWLGITDKYWLVSLIPDQKTSYFTRFKGQTLNDKDSYQVEAISPEYEVVPNGSVEVKYNLFAGAKILSMLDEYEEKLGFSRFDLAIDFGVLYFLTKPLFYFLEFLNKLFGNLGIAILIMTVVFKLALFPMANKSYRSLSRMKSLQPKIEALKQRYPDDKMRLNQEMMELYKKEKVNPLSGCLPIIVQAPIFFCLYKVLFVSLEMRQAPFFGWIHDLSAPDPTTLFNLFGLLPFTPPSFLMVGIWPILMGLSMFLQQRLNPQPADPTQAQVFMIMPILLSFVMAGFPSGVVIYWTWSNILSILQQWWIMRLEANRIASNVTR